MGDVGTFIAAVAAVAAAVLSLLTWLSTRRHEETKWRREAIVESLVRFLDASFDAHSGWAYSTRKSDADADMVPFRAYADASHEIQNEHLTRLRLLAPDDVVQAAENLHAADHTVIEAALGTTMPALAHWAEVKRGQKESRETLINNFRKTLGLSEGKLISHG